MDINSFYREIRLLCQNSLENCLGKDFFNEHGEGWEKIECSVSHT